jgi:hypothetical protein
MLLSLKMSMNGQHACDLKKRTECFFPGRKPALEAVGKFRPGSVAGGQITTAEIMHSPSHCRQRKETPSVQGHLYLAKK